MKSGTPASITSTPYIVVFESVKSALPRIAALAQELLRRGGFVGEEGGERRS